MHFTIDSTLDEVRFHPAFGDFGKLIFPLNPYFCAGGTIGEFNMTYYNFINPITSCAVLNSLKDRAEMGEKIFYPIYSDEEMIADPEKKNTGLFFFKGKTGARFSLCCAGGAFKYLGSLHDSFPLCLEMSRKGYNSFAIIYRCDPFKCLEDLAKGLEFIFDHAEELGVDPTDYSLWGGSAGGRMAASLGSHGTAHYGAKPLPKPATVVVQYAGHRDFTPEDPPTYSNCGKADWIVNWKIMEERAKAMADAGIPTEFHAYDDMPHGFALATGTAVSGWFDEAVKFWEKHQSL